MLYLLFVGIVVAYLISILFNAKSLEGLSAVLVKFSARLAYCLSVVLLWPFGSSNGQEGNHEGKSNARDFNRFFSSLTLPDSISFIWLRSS